MDAALARLGIMPGLVRVKWYGTRSPAVAARTLAKRARQILANRPAGEWVLSLGDGSSFHRRLNRCLERQNVSYQQAKLEDVARWRAGQARGLAAIVNGFADSRHTTLAAKAINVNPALAQTPFEYAPGLDEEAEIFGRLDEYSDTFFISPVLLDNPSPYAIYRESLEHFEQKCGLRDFLDLYQMLRSVVENNVPGDIAEFGSYRGHSGWLIARSLKALGSQKQLYMFDTFEEFPIEPLGIDQFWSQTHKVNFDQVKAKLAPFNNVTLVKGDFTETLANSGVGRLALAYIDCDSYRATRFLFDALLPERVSSGAVVICEDYGHPALLGNRLAVHESLDTKQGYVRFFSQFSGLYIITKY